MKCEKCKEEFKGNQCPKCGYKVKKQIISMIFGLITTVLLLLNSILWFTSAHGESIGMVISIFDGIIFLIFGLIFLNSSLKSSKRKKKCVSLIIDSCAMTIICFLLYFFADGLGTPAYQFLNVFYRIFSSSSIFMLFICLFILTMPALIGGILGLLQFKKMKDN